jgi:hypothetical protein
VGWGERGLRSCVSLWMIMGCNQRVYRGVRGEDEHGE